MSHRWQGIWNTWHFKNKGTCMVSIWVSKQYPGLPISLGIIFEKCSPVMHEGLATYLPTYLPTWTYYKNLANWKNKIWKSGQYGAFCSWENPLLYVEMTFFRSIFCDNLPQNIIAHWQQTKVLKKIVIYIYFQKFPFFGAKIVEITPK